VAGQLHLHEESHAAQSQSARTQTVSRKARDEGTDRQFLLIAIEQNTILHGALRKLSGMERQLFGLAFFHGLTYAEIMEQIRMPSGTVKTCLRRTMQCSRKQLAF
jgi:RNA polymerase sigma-70 factor (ECF subfamily)